MLKTAYHMGARRALTDHGIKIAAVDWEQLGDYMTPVLGAVNPIAAGVLSGATDPGTRYLQSGALTGLGSLGGGAGGSLLGGGLGYGLGSLLKRYADNDIDPALFALLGGGAGGILGGSIGAHYTRQGSKRGQTAKKTRKRLQK